MDLEFRVVQIESKDLANLLSLIEQEHTQNPEKWGDVLEVLETATETEIRWADWDMPDEDVKDSSIPFIRWGGQSKWQMGMTVPPSLVDHLSMKI